MKEYFIAHGGVIASVIGILISFNIAMTGIKSICDQLKIKEPGPLQKLAAIGSMLLGFLTANTNPKPPQAPQA